MYYKVVYFEKKYLEEERFLWPFRLLFRDFFVTLPERLRVAHKAERKVCIKAVDVFGFESQAVEWVQKINALKPEERMNRQWEYVLVSEDNFHGLSANGATITDICERCKVSLSVATGELFV